VHNNECYYWPFNRRFRLHLVDDNKRVTGMRGVSWIVGVLTLSAVALVSGCSKVDSPIVGKWVSDSGQGSIEFKPNEDVIVVDNMDLKITGKYKIEDDYTIFLRLKGPDIFNKESKEVSRYAIRANYEIRGNKLKITVEDEGEVLDYRRY